MIAALIGGGAVVLSALGTILYLTKTFRTVFGDLDEAYRNLMDERDKRAVSDANLMRAADNLSVMQSAYGKVLEQVTKEVASRKTVEAQRDILLKEIAANGDVNAIVDSINASLRKPSKN